VSTKRGFILFDRKISGRYDKYTFMAIGCQAKLPAKELPLPGFQAQIDHLTIHY
jgi:hypothetical protein